MRRVSSRRSPSSGVTAHSCRVAECRNDQGPPARTAPASTAPAGTARGRNAWSRVAGKLLDGAARRAAILPSGASMPSRLSIVVLALAVGGSPAAGQSQRPTHSPFVERQFALVRREFSGTNAVAVVAFMERYFR